MILCIGEILADMMGYSQDGVLSYQRFAGGAPFNVACGIKKFGGRAGFYGVVGEDIIGNFLRDFAHSNKLDVCLIDTAKGVNTTLAFVEHSSDGERNFCFYRFNTADSRLCFESVKELIKNADIIHLGSLPLSEKHGFDEILNIISYAKSLNKVISFDVNYRSDILGGKIDGLKQIIGLSDIVKLSEDELYLLTGKSELQEAIAEFSLDTIVSITLGKKGSACIYRDEIIRQGSIEVKAVDTTGAGDAFYAGFLTKLDIFGYAKDKSKLQASQIADALRFGNIAGALTVTKRGAIDALPDLKTINEIKL